MGIYEGGKMNSQTKLHTDNNIPTLLHAIFTKIKENQPIIMKNFNVNNITEYLTDDSIFKFVISNSRQELFFANISYGDIIHDNVTQLPVLQIADTFSLSDYLAKTCQHRDLLFLKEKSKHLLEQYNIHIQIKNTMYSCFIHYDVISVATIEEICKNKPIDQFDFFETLAYLFYYGQTSEIYEHCQKFLKEIKEFYDDNEFANLDYLEHLMIN